jgi:hypothetical protein
MKKALYILTELKKENFNFVKYSSTTEEVIIDKKLITEAIKELKELKKSK